MWSKQDHAPLPRGQTQLPAVTPFHRQKLEPPPLSQAKVVTLGAAVIHLLALTLDPLSKRKERRRETKRKSTEDEEEEETITLKRSIGSMEKQGEKLTEVMLNLQQTRSKQLEMMTSFMGSLL